MKALAQVSPWLVFHLPSRPLLNAAVTPVLLSKELSTSSDGYGFSFSWSLVWWRWKLLTPRPKIQCVLPVTDDDIYSLFRESSVTIHQIHCTGKNSFHFPVIFPVQVWQWRILTIIKETLCVKSNIINFYIFVIQIILTKETWSLCYLVIFFGIHLHYLTFNVIDFQWFWFLDRHFYIVLSFFFKLEMSKTVLLSFYHHEISPEWYLSYIGIFDLNCPFSMTL